METTGSSSNTPAETNTSTPWLLWIIWLVGIFLFVAFWWAIIKFAFFR